MTDATPATPAAAPPPTGIPFVSDAVRLVRGLFSPGEVFAELDQRPVFWKPWVIISVLYVVLQFLQRPFQQRITQLVLERAGRPVPPATIARDIMGAVTGPIIVLVLIAIGAGILYLLVSSLGGETTFKKMMVVMVHTWPLMVLQQAITWAILTTRGVASITGPQDLIVSLGADLLLPADARVGYFLRFVLGGIGPLQIWALVITAVGAMVLGKATKGAAWTAAIIHYVIILVLLSGFGAFGMKMAASVVE